MSQFHPKSRSWGLALTALLSAVYAAYALLSSYVLGSITHGIDNFILRSLVFVILGGLTVGFGYSTMMGGITGILLEFTVPTPIPLYLFPSLLAYGLIFDIVLNLYRNSETNPSMVRMMLGTVLASFSMSVVALTVFTLVGFFPPESIPVIWTLEITIDVALGVIGAFFGLVLLRQLKHIKPTG